MEDSARTQQDFENVIAWWDRLDANREQRERYRELSRSGDDVPDILNELDDADYIRQGNHPSRSKSVYITESGMEQAKELLSQYGISDWKQG